MSSPPSGTTRRCRTSEPDPRAAAPPWPARDVPLQSVAGSGAVALGVGGGETSEGLLVLDHHDERRRGVGRTSAWCTHAVILSRPAPGVPGSAGHDEHTVREEQTGHQEHSGHDEHSGHSSRAGHGDHVAVFRRLFWTMLVVAVPVVAFSPMLAMLVGYDLPTSGWTAWVSPVLGVVKPTHESAATRSRWSPVPARAGAGRRGRHGARTPRAGRPGTPDPRSPRR